MYDQQFFLLSSIMFDGLPSEQSIFHLDGNLLIKCALTDPCSNYLPLKLTKPYHFEISWYNWFISPLLSVLLSDTVYYIWFCQQRLYFHIGITILRWPVLHLLIIHQLSSSYVHIWMHVKGFMWLIIIIWQIFPSHVWIVHKQHVRFL